MRLRNKIGHAIQRRLAPRDVSIISDDCWGGQYYRVLGIPYLTPTVGCWIEPDHYLDFVLTVLSVAKLEAAVAKDTKDYPVLSVGLSRLHFIHDTNTGEALDKFARRVQRINRRKLFVKVDFGKYYSPAEVERWNALALPNSVALYPSGSILANNTQIHHGVAIDAWNIDGAKMYGISQRSLDVIHWLKTGKIGCRLLYSSFERAFVRST